MTYERNYDIAIAVDAGYSSSKVVINGLELNIPNAVVDITHGSFMGDMHKAGFIMTSYIDGTDHLIGSQAKTQLQETEYKEVYESKKSMMQSYERFNTQDFEVHLMTCIGMALIEYSKHLKKNKITPELDLTKVIDENSQWNIFVNIGFPHDVYQKVFTGLKRNIAKAHSYKIETEDAVYDLNFTIKPENVMAYSQALAAYMGLILNDEGKMLKDSSYFKKLPLIVVDGGQKTVGIYKVTRNLQIESAESNTDYAMDNVYERVLKVLHEKYNRTDIELYNIDMMQKTDDGNFHTINADGKAETHNIFPIIKEAQEEVCQEFIEYLNKKYNQLLDIKSIVVAGGTGDAYFDTMKAYIEEYKDFLKDSFYLAENDFFGRKAEPVFAVAIGLYRVLIRGIREQRRSAEKEQRNNQKSNK